MKTTDNLFIWTWKLLPQAGSFLGRVGYSKGTGEFSAVVYPWPPQLVIIGSTELAVKLAPPGNEIPYTVQWTGLSRAVVL